MIGVRSKYWLSNRSERDRHGVHATTRVGPPFGLLAEFSQWRRTIALVASTLGTNNWTCSLQDVYCLVVLKKHSPQDGLPSSSASPSNLGQFPVINRTHILSFQNITLLITTIHDIWYGRVHTSADLNYIY